MQSCYSLIKVGLMEGVMLNAGMEIIKRESKRAGIRLLVLALVLLGWGYLGVPYALGMAHGDENGASEEPAKYVRTELFYGGGLREGRGDYETMWEEYLNNVVTPRFPEGLTQIEASGQWRVREGRKPRRTPTRILILVHRDSPENFGQLEEIRRIWKEMSGHRSVLRVTIPADVDY